MSTVKTAISLDADLFRKAEGLARSMKVSRSHLFATALAELIDQRRNRDLLEAVNAAYTGGAEPSETKLRRAMRRHHRRLARRQR